MQHGSWIWGVPCIFPSYWPPQSTRRDSQMLHPAKLAYKLVTQKSLAPCDLCILSLLFFSEIYILSRQNNNSSVNTHCSKPSQQEINVQLQLHWATCPIHPRRPQSPPEHLSPRDHQGSDRCFLRSAAQVV